MIMLTAADVEDRVRGLRAGADDLRSNRFVRAAGAHQAVLRRAPQVHHEPDRMVLGDPNWTPYVDARFAPARA